MRRLALDVVATLAVARRSRAAAAAVASASRTVVTELVVMRYVDLNPVRAGLVRSPRHWRWSSFRHDAYGEPDDLITDASEYQALGRTSYSSFGASARTFTCSPAAGQGAALADAPTWSMVHSSATASRVTIRLEACGLSPPAWAGCVAGDQRGAVARSRCALVRTRLQPAPRRQEMVSKLPGRPGYLPPTGARPRTRFPRSLVLLGPASRSQRTSFAA